MFGMDGSYCDHSITTCPRTVSHQQKFIADHRIGGGPIFTMSRARVCVYTSKTWSKRYESKITAGRFPPKRLAELGNIILKQLRYIEYHCIPVGWTLSCELGE
jgi:hypothetical protein